ncbi:putative UDP-N-acetylmuramate dehydrogenase [Magnetofaba australis IT-1]|uniref:UDP-N-acetylenolpyruvoylglucosamine reductase n=1 Tax=Magnetofaba australis IT-1 TaxID=1434232 RepID=A0A1Y2K8J1_9PROT|nr:putative UDP-N-acetylmuramate dehydrogenase [Magnetofaba australis IT-1]
MLGGGSNLLINDDGFDGVAVTLCGGLQRISFICADDQDARIEAEAGADTRALAHFARRNGLSGAEFLCGIPGSLGGALRMNAGAYGGQMRDIVATATLMDPDGALHTLDVDALGMRYRATSAPKDWLFVSAQFTLRRDDPEAIRQRMRVNNRKRTNAQPLAFPSAGSVFRNPPGHSAWRLIDQAGLRGHAIGAAQISEKHSNFFVNRGGARASDMRALIDLTRHQVKSVTGVDLTLEVGLVERHRLVTEPPLDAD